MSKLTKFRAREVTLSGREAHLLLAVLQRPGKGTDYHKAADLMAAIEDWYAESVEPVFAEAQEEKRPVDMAVLDEIKHAFQIDDRVCRWAQKIVEDSSVVNLSHAKHKLALEAAFRKAAVVELAPAKIRPLRDDEELPGIPDDEDEEGSEDERPNPKDVGEE